MQTEEEGWFFRNHLVTYYKNRGNTEGPCVELLQLIKSCGFEFEI